MEEHGSVEDPGFGRSLTGRCVGRPYASHGMPCSEEHQPDMPQLGENPGDGAYEQLRVEPLVEASAPDKHEIVVADARERVAQHRTITCRW